MTGYKVGFEFANQAEPSYNAQVFPTKYQAELAGRELMSRWILPIGFQITEVNQEANYKMESAFNRPVMIEDDGTN